MYTGSHYVALRHNLVGLWFFGLNYGLLLCIGGYTGGMLIGCAWWCAFRLFSFYLFYYLFYFLVGLIYLFHFLVVHGASFYFGLCFKLFL